MTTAQSSFMPYLSKIATTSLFVNDLLLFLFFQPYVNGMNLKFQNIVLWKIFLCQMKHVLKEKLSFLEAGGLSHIPVLLSGGIPPQHFSAHRLKRCLYCINISHSAFWQVHAVCKSYLPYLIWNRGWLVEVIFAGLMKGNCSVLIYCCPLLLLSPAFVLLGMQPSFLPVPWQRSAPQPPPNYLNEVSVCWPRCLGSA